MSDERPTNLRANVAPTEGYAVVIDAKIKSNYATRDEAFNAGLEIKRKFPVVNVTVWDVSEGTRTAVKLPQ